MRLKSLIISGFKSFPRRTVINFSQGVSAIVGPNGSGKSNIVDAIRWVLGEQNPRLLRAEKMEDLIFSGNSSLSTESCRVRLSLDECQDMAPPELKDLSEIEIERVIFRDGSSKFLLNGKNCRLKDIRYIFLDTGTGARSYSIIDQGRVGQFVTMTPEERRLIVEEAAGIARYRQRRIEALSRMKTTVENLERLKDVIAEVKRQANALKRQAKKAKRFIELRKREDRLQMSILKRRYLNLESNGKSIKSSINSLENEKAALEGNLESICLDTSRLDLELDEAFSKKKAIKEDLKKIKKECDSAFLEISRIEKELAVSKQQEHSLRSSRSSLEGRIFSLKSQLEHLKKEKAKDEKLLCHIETDINEVKELEKQASRNLSRLKERREEIKDGFVMIASKRAQLFEKVSSFVVRKQSLEETIERMTVRKEKLLEEKALLERNRKELENRIKKAEFKDEEVRLRLHEYTDELVALKEKLNAIQANIDKLKATFAGYNARLLAVKRLDEQGVGLSEGSNRLRKKIGKKTKLVLDVIEVEDGYEELVEAALGHTLQSFIVDDMENALDILEAICMEPDKYGATSFFISEGAFRKKLFDKNMGQIRLQDALDSLGNKVSGNHPVASIIKNLLSSWLVTESMADFLRSPQKMDLNDGKKFIISKDGFLLTNYGEIRHVPLASGKDIGIISRKKEIKVLYEKIRSVKKQLSLEEERKLRFFVEEKKLSKKVVLLEEKIENQKEETGQLKKQLSELKLRLEAIEDRLELISYEKDERLAELLEVGPNISSLRSRLKEAEYEETSFKERLSTVEKDLQVKEDELSKITGKKNHLLLEKEKISTRLNATEKEITRIFGELESADRKLNDDLSKIKELSTQKAHLEKELESAKNLLNEKKILLTKRQHVLQDTDRLIDIKREKKMLLDRKKGKLKAKLSKIAMEINGHGIRLSENEQKMAQIREGLFREYRKKIDEILNDESLDSNEDMTTLQGLLDDCKRRLESFGPVNLMAVDEYQSLEERLGFLLEQERDIRGSLKDIERAIERIDRECRKKFSSALDAINESLKEIFPILFEGGQGWLHLVDEKRVLDSGVDYSLKLPGKRISSLSLLSGGEKALSALALIFAIFLMKPAPFCLLDEVDAPLDEANTLKFNSLVRRISTGSQVIVVTHNQNVMEMADCLYGVTMEEKGISKLVTVKMV